MRPTVPSLLLLFICIFAASDLCAATLTVTKTADTSDGVCDGDCSLREAVIAAASGDTVVFSSLFNSPQTITLTLGQITIDKNLTITGTGQNLVTFSGNNTSRIFRITGGVTVNLSGMTFRDGNPGNPNGLGGAIRVDTSTLNVSNATFTNNTASGLGGAIYGGEQSTFTLSNLVVIGNFSPGSAIDVYSIDIQDSEVKQNSGSGISSGITMSVRRCVISDNTGKGVGAQHLTIIDSTVTNNTNGGVVSGDGKSTMTMERCLISGNSRNPSGAGVLSAGTAIIKDTQITNNSAISGGGGITNLGTLYLINSGVFGNRSQFGSFGDDGGGGILNSTGRLYVTNSTVSTNTASGNPGVGGGIYSSNFFEILGRVYLVNSTIANNTSSGAGGGVIIAPPNGEGTFSNTVVAGNNSTGTTQEDVSGIIISNGINLIGNTLGSSGWIPSDLLNVNPMLGPLADNGGSTMTHALLPGSPARDAGNNALAVDPQTQMFLIDDQRGFPRRVGVLVDIGAYESTQTSSPVIAGSITYGLGPPRFVPNVLISGAGLPNVSATTLGAGPGQGTYLLTGFGSRSYTVTPTKTGDVGNSLSSFDSGRIAQHVAAIITLTGNQLIVADVSGNGTLSSFDAGQIARYVAGLDNSGASANWIFIPVNRTYPSVTSNITGEDFIALLMGDVSGNWMPTGNK